MRLPLIVAVLLFATTPAYAEFIDLTQVSYGPSNTLVIGGVTFWGTGSFGTAPPHDRLVSAVQGVGVGLGADGSIDRYDGLGDGRPSQFWTPEDGDDLLMGLSVDGFINSLTVVSSFILDGPPLPAGFGSWPLTLRAIRADAPSSLVTAAIPVGDFSRTIDLSTLHTSTLVELGVYTDSTLDTRYRQYLIDNGFPDVTFTTHLSITGIDYTPAPEPSTLLLSSLGIAAGYLRRRRGMSA